MRHTLYWTLFVGASLLAGPAAAAPRRAPSFAACTAEATPQACQNACQQAERRFGIAHAYDQTSHAMRKACFSLLRAAEAAQMRGPAACATNACLYKLKGLAPPRLNLYRGSGFTVRIAHAPVPPYAGGQLYFLTDPRGAKSRFESCGSCDISDVEFEAGAHRRARLYSGDRQAVMLRMPATRPFRGLPHDRHCFAFAGQTYCEPLNTPLL